ncbi:hypothetical protein EDB87DRAFT_422577 [Lactarius vividus]|nr:hypothetical protein EDB87DRAFT_422577 [Lactarius vividus]
MQVDMPSTRPSPTDTHVDAGSDISRPSLAAGFFERTVQRDGHSPPSPGKTDMGSDTTQEAGLNVEPFAFKPLELVDLVDSKSLENLERLGGVEGLLRGLGTNRLRGLSMLSESRDHGTLNAMIPDGVEMTSLKPNITTISPARVPQGLANIAGGSGVDHRTSSSLAGAYDATIEDRQRIYGQNILPQRPRKSLLLLMWRALQDRVLLWLTTVAILSFALSLFLDFSTTYLERDPLTDWVESVAITVAILIVVTVGSLNDWQKERQFKTFNEKKEDHRVKVIRDGRERQIPVHQVVVGDVVLLEPGEVIPCDGVLLSGHNVWCDESSATGELDTTKKLSYEECVALRDKRLMEFDPDAPYGGSESVSASQRRTNPSCVDFLGHGDCFIAGGSKVLEGVGSYVVISVGTKSFGGRSMMASRRDSENTPLQLKLSDLADATTKIGSIAGCLFFVILLIRYLVQRGTNYPWTPNEKGAAFVNILNIVVTLVVVAVPEGLPLAVTLALAIATKRMAKENLLVHTLGSCETMANASVICTDKAGTLTQNRMTIVAVSVDVHKFVRRLEENREGPHSEARSNPNAKDFDVNLAGLNTILPDPLKDLFNAAIAINSTAFEDVDPESRSPVFIGSKTETALLGFAKELGWPHYKDTRDSANVVQMIPFSSERKSMGCVVQLLDGSHRLFVKGASEVLAWKCTRHVAVHPQTTNSAPSGNEVETAPIGETEEDNISRTISSYASQALRTIALCYPDFPCWPPYGARLLDKDEVDYDDLTTDLTLICIIAIEDPLRVGIREAVADCDKARVRVKMCTGENVLTARSIAQQCGIYTTGGIIMEGPRFRKLSPDVMKAIVPRLQVLAWSSPEDKRILVETLKELGEVVVVTGEGSSDEPVLKTAHVGFSMGVAGTEVAKEASDIVLMDDDFSSIVKAIVWGRCVNDSVRKFLQFQVSANITAIVIMFVWALASDEEEPILSAVQLLWIKIVIGTFAAIALVTDPASPVLLNRNPGKKTDPLITVNMTKQILGQAVYQLAITLILHFFGSQILGFHPTDDLSLQKHHDDIVQTLIFNVFVFAQIFNLFNCRRLDRKLNVCEGVSKNWYFVAIITIDIAVQVLICSVDGSVFDVTRIGAREWCISVALGCVALPLGALIRLVPNDPCERVFKNLHLLPRPERELLPTICPGAEPGLSFTVNDVRGTFARQSGARTRGSSFVHKSCSAFPNPDGRPVPGLLAMNPSQDASRLKVPGWQLRPSGSPCDPACLSPSMSSSTPCENVFEVHPDTPLDDPVYTACKP